MEIWYQLLYFDYAQIDMLLDCATNDIYLYCAEYLIIMLLNNYRFVSIAGQEMAQLPGGL